MYFLGHINNKRWLSAVGSTILLHAGPLSQAALQAQLQQLRQGQPAESVNLTKDCLKDFWVMQVLRMPDAMATAEVAALAAAATQARNPVPVKDSLLKDVFLLTDEYDDLKITRLALFKDGSLQVSVSLPSILKGTSFHLVGQLNLLEPAPVELPAD